MKRFLTAVFGAALLLVTGCSGSQAQAVKTTVESFLKTQQQGDLDASQKYLTGDAAGMIESTEAIRQGLQDYEKAGVKSETLDAFIEAQTRAYAMVWETCETGDVQVEGNKATALVKTTGIAMDDWDKLTESGLAGEVGRQWIEDHQREVDDYKSTHTDEEYQAWYLDQVVPVYARTLLSRLESLERQTTNYRMTLVKDGDDWKISNIEVGTYD